MIEHTGRREILRTLFTLSSLVNVLGGAVLAAIWGRNAFTDPQHHVPLIVLAIGGSMMIQGFYSTGYSLGWWKAWGDISTGALLAGQLISGCVGLGMLVDGIFYMARATNGGIEPAPVLAGLMIGVNALLGLILLVLSGVLAPKTPVQRLDQRPLRSLPDKPRPPLPPG